MHSWQVPRSKGLTLDVYRRRWYLVNQVLRGAGAEAGCSWCCALPGRPLRAFDLVKDRDTGSSKGYGFCVYQVRRWRSLQEG